MPIAEYAKLGGALLVVVLLFGGGYHFGGLASRAAYEALRAEQSSNTAKAVLAERASAAIELARVNAVLKEYQDAPIDPVTVGIGHRVLYAACPASSPVPKAAADPGGAIITRAVAPGVESALQGLVDACSRDAVRLNAIQAAWPR